MSICLKFLFLEYIFLGNSLLWYVFPTEGEGEGDQTWLKKIYRPRDFILFIGTLALTGKVHGPTFFKACKVWSCHTWGRTSGRLTLLSLELRTLTLSIAGPVLVSHQKYQMDTNLTK